LSTITLTICNAQEKEQITIFNVAANDLQGMISE